MVGVDDNHFAPGDLTTRGMVVTVLHRIEGKPSANGTGFTDVEGRAWYTKAILWAQANGIVEGYGDGTFHPNASMTREEMMAVFYRYSQYKGYDVSEATALTVFADNANIQTYAEDAMSWAVAVGLIKGFPDGTIRPQADSERAQLATVLMRFCQMFESGETFTVVFDSNGGSRINTQIVRMGEAVKYPGIPAKDGYTFAGWYFDVNESDLTNQYDFSQIVTEDMVLYAKWIDSNLDTDTDGIPDELEPYFSSDPFKFDTDNDGLNDYEECVVLGTAPNHADTDANGITDYYEDADKDNVLNGAEFSLQIDPVNPDTDFDGLLDGEEVYSDDFATDPSLADTDGDNANDYWEISNGFDPTHYNDSFHVIEESVAADISVSVSVDVPGEKAISLSVTPIVEHPVLTSDMPGYIGVPFEFNIENNLEGATATISFTFSDVIAYSEDFQPTIYYYNEDNQLLEELETYVDGNVASATVEHFSTYILLNKADFDAIWENEIKPPIGSGDGTNPNIDVVFVIDCSGSMSSSSRMTTAKAALHTFIAALHDVDRAALVSFTSYATTLSELTTDKGAVDAMVDSLQADGLTAMYTGLDQAIEMLTKEDENYGYKMIIVLSDGTDEPSTSYSGYYEALVEKASTNNIIVYTIGAGNSVSTSILTKVAEGTGGAYYKATMTSGITDAFEEIQGDTVDLTTDTDNDKLPDYYEQLLTNSAGVLFNLDIHNPDCDNDGLMDGEEIVLTQSGDGKVYGIIKSDPWNPNTDGDAYNDGKEVNTYDTDPLIANVVFMNDDTSFLLENENFVSDKYLDLYENKYIGWLERVSVWLGNNAFGSNHDTVYMYKTILMKYLEQMVEESEEANEIRELIGFTRDFLSTANDSIGVALDSVEGDNLEYLDNLRQQLSHYQQNLDDIANADLISAGYTKEQVYKLWDDVFADYQEVSEKIPELETKIEFNQKVSKAGDVAGIVLDVADVFLTGYDGT